MIGISNKRSILWLSLSTLFSLSFIGIAISFISYRGLVDIHPLLPSLLFLAVSALLCYIAFNIFSLIFGAISGKAVAYPDSLRNLFFRFLYPIMAFSGRIFGLSKEKIQQVFIEVNNLLIRSNPRYVRPERLLILLPHCLQFNECPIRITWNVYNCAGCGSCEIKDLAEMAREAAINLSVATGGGLARRIVDEKRPEAIIAVACERELVSGIPDVYPLPVLGIINKRPFGPCLNTRVEIEDVKDALRYLTGR